MIESIFAGAIGLLEAAANKYMAYKAGNITGKTFQWMERSTVNAFTRHNTTTREENTMYGRDTRTSLARRGSSSGIKPMDGKEIKGCINALTARRNEIAGLNDEIKVLLQESGFSMQSIMAKALHAIVPKSAYPLLPDSVVKFVVDEYDALERVEALLRDNIHGTQDALMVLAASARTKREELDQLTADLEQARAENWDARTLQDYMASMSGVEVYAEVAELLDAQFNILPEEAREARKVELLNQLTASLKTGEALMDTLSRVCDAGLQVFAECVTQYYGYVGAYKPIAAIRDAATQLTRANVSALVAKEAIIKTFDASLAAINLAVDMAAKADKYAITSSSTVEMLEAGQKSVEQKLADLDRIRVENTKKLTADKYAGRPKVITTSATPA